MWEVFLDAVIDTIKVVPILYLVYLLVSYLGHNNNNRYAKLMNKTEKLGPLIGGVTGCIPQCGFSVVMADLYSKKAITIGTIVAVMLATSDEAIPIMISSPNFIVPMLILIAIKLVVAVLFGYIFDLSLKLFGKKQNIDSTLFNKIHNHDCDLTSCSYNHKVHNHSNEEDEKIKDNEHEHNEHEHKEHEHKEHNCVDNIFLESLLHTLQITAFLFVATFIIGIIVEYAGIENVSKMFTANKYVQPFIAALIGLIPNCASSVFLVEFYMAGGITFGAMLAGLTAGSGIGILVLFTKNRKHMLTNFIILVSLYLIGSLVGLVCTFFI